MNKLILIGVIMLVFPVLASALPVYCECIRENSPETPGTHTLHAWYQAPGTDCCGASALVAEFWFMTETQPGVFQFSSDPEHHGFYEDPSTVTSTCCEN